MDAPEEIIADADSRSASKNLNRDVECLRDLLHQNADELLRRILRLLSEASKLRAENEKLRAQSSRNTGGTGDMPQTPSSEPLFDLAKAPEYSKLQPWDGRKAKPALSNAGLETFGSKPPLPGQQIAWMHVMEDEQHSPQKGSGNHKVTFEDIQEDNLSDIGETYQGGGFLSKSDSAKDSASSDKRDSMSSGQSETDQLSNSGANLALSPTTNNIFGSSARISNVKKNSKANARKSTAAGERDGDKGKSQQAVFADASAMKEKIREAVLKKEYAVEDFYWERGICQAVARSQIFQNTTLMVIAFNAIWISIDTDGNKADTLMDAHPIFQVAEHAFCTYFTAEWLFRLGAFKRKQDGFRDAWFVFDTALVLMMVLETWVMNFVLFVILDGSASGTGGLGNAELLKLVRLMRLTRMARMARLLRAFPELIILIKGIAVAMRSVIFTLILLFILIYFFAIVFTQLATESLQEEYFPNVRTSMMSLLLDAVLPDMADIVRDCADQHLAMGFLILLFILMASLTVMNMLIGVLCEVINVVSSVEKEQLTVSYVKTRLLSMFDKTGLDADNSQSISKAEFESLVIRPEAAKIIQEIGVDVIGLVDFSDYIFQEGSELSFADFMELILQLRGSNNSTVKDIVDLRRCIVQQMCALDNKVKKTMTSCMKASFDKECASVVRKSIAEAFSQSRCPSKDGVAADEAIRSVHPYQLLEPQQYQQMMQQINPEACAVTYTETDVYEVQQHPRSTNPSGTRLRRAASSSPSNTGQVPMTVQVPSAMQQAGMMRPTSRSNSRPNSATNQRVRPTSPALPAFSAKMRQREMWKDNGEKEYAPTGDFRNDHVMLANEQRIRQGRPTSANRVAFIDPWEAEDDDEGLL